MVVLFALVFWFILGFCCCSCYIMVWVFWCGGFVGGIGRFVDLVFWGLGLRGILRFGSGWVWGVIGFGF